MLKHPRMSVYFDRRSSRLRMQSILGGLRCRGKGCASHRELQSEGMARSEPLVSLDRPLLGT